MFQTRKPRQFNRVSIYSNERQEKIDKLVREVKQEAGELPADQPGEVSFKGKFARFTPRAQRASQSQHRLSWPIALMVIALLILAWHYIITGKI